ncbi:MAG: gamma-glutamyl-gamma-aminobutyrate hydrolase family protein [Candidatus Saccharimonadales bacterium]
MTKPNKVAILDAGGQYVDLVKKAVQRIGIEAEVLPLNTSAENIEQSYGAIIISGSPANISHQEKAPQPDPKIWESSLPLFGICYGMQAMVTFYGGKVEKNAIREDGRVSTIVDNTHPLFKGTKKELTGLFTHGDFVKELPEGFKTIGSHKLSDGLTAYSSIAKDNKLGVQFHPEVFDDTPEGYQLFKNFLLDIARLVPDENFVHTLASSLIETKLEHIKQVVGERHVIAFVSGGVDSSVAATLSAKVINKDKMHAFYIDSGFMRDEDDQVVDALRQAGIPVERVDAVEQFEKGTTEIDGKTYGPLINVTDPEQKRKIIGKVFIDIQNNLITKLNLTEAILLQGTNAADRIESGHSKGDTNTMTIKTHHNQVKEVQQLKEDGLLLEPIDDLFKDEIRRLGKELGLPEELVQRQPFPGPGLAIRILAAEESKDTIEKNDIDQEIQSYAQTLISQPISAKLLPIKSIGVGGDERSHKSVVALQANIMSGDLLASFGHEIPAHFRDDVNRVIFALGPNSINTLHLTKTLLTRDVREQLRHADKIVYEEMRSHNLLGKIDQFPVVLLPISCSEVGGRSIVLRPVKTSTFMTVQAMLPGPDYPDEFLRKVTNRIISEVDGITQVFLDVTNKPPATTEWE